MQRTNVNKLKCPSGVKIKSVFLLLGFHPFSSVNRVARRAGRVVCTWLSGWVARFHNTQPTWRLRNTNFICITVESGVSAG